MVDVDKCCMTRFPEPVLTQVAKPVESIDDSIKKLSEKMIDIMLESGGVGLAAPQAGVNLRIFVVSPDGTKENAKIYINPEIELSGPLESNDEGCLSIPGVFAKIKRYKKCTITATDLDGNTFTEEATGLLIRAFQHEYDHLEGIMIKDRMSQAARIASRKKLKQLQKDYEQKNENLQ
jgi:peptide deformylase